METKIKKPAKSNKLIMRMCYSAFVLLGIYFFIRGEWSSGVAQFGVALVFDPFDQEVTWKQRPFYQRAWMIVHLILLLAFFILMFYTGK
jgi:hypothetical protein